MRWLGFALGCVIVAATAMSLVTTFVLPRGNTRWQVVPVAVSKAVRAFFLVLARPAPTFAHKDDILAAIGPVALSPSSGLPRVVHHRIRPYAVALDRHVRGRLSESGVLLLFSVGLVHLERPATTSSS